VVFDDANGNGSQDEGEVGLSGVTLEVTHDATGEVAQVSTGADGAWRFEASSVNHRVRVDVSTLPFLGELTTGRESYNLNIPPAFVAPLINFGYQEVVPAAATGVVFDDANGNGSQDEGESGLSGVDVVAVHDETGEATVITTGPDGSWRFEAARVNHAVRVDVSTLPWPAELTTGRSEYNLNIPSGFTAPAINFGYQEVVPAAAAGTVFRDRNANGEQDEGESGLADVTLVATHVDTGETSTITTDADGAWRFEDAGIRHVIGVDTETIPFPAVLTTSRAEYRLNIPAGFVAPNIDFGYDVAESSGGGSVTESEPEPEPSPAEPDGVDPFEDPDPDFDPFPDPAVDEDPQPGLVPKEGPWSATNYEGFLDCGGFSLAIPASVPEIGFLEVLDGGATLIGRPVNPGDAPVTMTADAGILGRYTGAFTASEAGQTITINFFMQVVTDEYIVGYLTSTFGAEGVTCTVFRSFDLRYAG